MTDYRRFLITVGVDRYDALDPRAQLPSVVDDVQAVTDLFCGKLAYERVLGELAEGPTASVARERLGDWMSSTARRPTDCVVVYWSGHGETGHDGRHYLLGRSFDGYDYLGKALATEDLGRMIAGSRLQHLLFIVDTCSAGGGIGDLVALANSLDRARPGCDDVGGAMFLVAASRRNEDAAEGVFSRLLVNAVSRQRHGGWTQPFLDPARVVEGINERMEREGTGQRAVLHVIGSRGGLSPILPNPRSDPAIPEGIDIESGRLRLDLASHWSPRARGVGLEIEQGDFFHGRVAALRALVAWIEREESPGLRVVTGRPGSGKSSLLGRLRVASHPKYREHLDRAGAPDGTILAAESVDVSIHARGKSVADVTAEIADALGCDNAMPFVLEAAAARDRPPVLLVDALDEALDPRGMARELLRPIVGSHTIKLIVGTREHVIAALGAAKQDILDLDLPEWLGETDVEDYVEHILSVGPLPDAPSPYASDDRLRRRVARQVATRARSTFLIARLVARSLAERPEPIDVTQSGWSERLPETVGEAFDEWLDRFDDKSRVRDLLRPLAFAQGGGLPWENLWPPIAQAIAGRPYGDSDVEWVLDVAGAFVVEVRQAGRSAYRLFHEALAEHLRPEERSPLIQERVAAALEASVPKRDGRREWTQAHVYVRTHLATHAAAAGRLRDLVEDAGFLVAADPTRMLKALGSSAVSVDVRRAYQRAAHLLHGAGSTERASYLELHARRLHADDVADRIADCFPRRPWSARWAQWRSDSEHFIAGRQGGYVSAVRLGLVDDRPLAVSGGSDKEVRLWDLAAGLPLGQPLRAAEPPKDEHGGWYRRGVPLVGFATIEGRATVVAQRSTDAAIEMWDLETGEPMIDAAEDLGKGWATLGTVCGRTMLVIQDSETTTVWDLDTDDPRPALLASHEIGGPSRGGWFSQSTLGALRGRAALVRHANKTIAVIDLLSGELLAAIEDQSSVTGVALSQLGTEPVVVASVQSSDTLTVHDLEGNRLDEVHTDRAGWANAVFIGELRGRPVALTGGRDRTVRIWDLNKQQQVNGPLIGHTAGVNALDFGVLDGRPIVLSGGDDETVRVWDLDAGEEPQETHEGHRGPVRCVAVGNRQGRPVAVTGSRDKTARFWDLESGRPLEDEYGEAGDELVSVSAGTHDGECIFALATRQAIWLTRVNGEPHAHHLVAASEPIIDVEFVELEGRPYLAAACDCAIHLWKVPNKHHQFALPSGHIGIRALATAAIDGATVAVSGGGEGNLAIWDLAKRERRGDLLVGHKGWVTSATLGHLNGVPVVVSGGSDNTVRIWSAVDGTPARAPFIGHTDWVNAVAIASDGLGGVIVSGDDRLVKVWDAGGTELISIAVDSPVRAIASRGTTVVVASDAGAMALELGAARR